MPGTQPAGLKGQAHSLEEKPEGILPQSQGRSPARGNSCMGLAVTAGPRGCKASSARSTSGQKPLGLQSCASLLVEAFFPQTDGQGSALFWAWGRSPQCPRGGPRLPQGEALAALPSLQAVQNESAPSFTVTTSRPWWSAPEALGSPFVIGMGNLGQGSSENLAPGVAGGCYMPQDRRLGRLGG